jgi:arsenate reductase
MIEILKQGKPHRVGRRGEQPLKRMLVLCTGNSARRQMGEGLFRHEAGELCQVESAGTKPSLVRPEAIAAMREIGVGISV